MPLTESGEDVLANMQEQYGDEKGKEVFYASINKGKKGSEKWHGGKKRHARGRRRGLRHQAKAKGLRRGDFREDVRATM